jgi:hypothetical protein
MTQRKKSPPKPLTGKYRTLVVDVEKDPAASEPDTEPRLADIHVPKKLKEQMARLDLGDLDPEAEARRREAAVPESADQQLLVDYFEGGGECSERLTAAYLRETRRREPNDALFLRYHHQGSAQLERLIIACIAQHPSDKGLLYDLANLGRFRGNADTAIDCYCEALIIEEDWSSLREMAQDICDHEQLMTTAARERFKARLADEATKWQLIKNAMERFGGSDE